MLNFFKFLSGICKKNFLRLGQSEILGNKEAFISDCISHHGKAFISVPKQFSFNGIFFGNLLFLADSQNFENGRVSRKKCCVPKKDTAAENRRQVEQGFCFLGCHTCEI